MEGISYKIKKIIEEFNLNNYSFSKRIGVTSTTVDSIINGRPQSDGSRKKTKPGYDVLKAIITEFDINPDYLFGKDEQLFRSDNKSTSYSGMPKVIAVDQAENENIIYVPVKARAGYLNGYGDANFVETLSAFNMPHLRNGSYRCFEIQGNSMSPTFSEGDMAFGKYVEKLNEMKDGRVYIIISKDDGIVIKRVINRIEESEKLVLKSDNKNGDYPSYTINAKEIMEVWDVTLFASKQMPEPVDVYDRLHELESQLVVLKESMK